jgi:hypothetical protein
MRSKGTPVGVNAKWQKPLRRLYFWHYGRQSQDHSKKEHPGGTTFERLNQPYFRTIVPFGQGVNLSKYTRRENGQVRYGDEDRVGLYIRG